MQRMIVGKGRVKVPAGLKQARDKALEQNWVIGKGKNNHLRWYPPDGGPFVVTAATTSYWRASKNAIASLKRAGLDI
jgi:hypothetical protein